MLPVKVSPAKETRRRTGLTGADAGDVEFANPHHSNDSSPQKALLSHSHYPSSDKPLVCPAARSSHSDGLLFLLTQFLASFPFSTKLLVCKTSRQGCPFHPVFDCSASADHLQIIYISSRDSYCRQRMMGACRDSLSASVQDFYTQADSLKAAKHMAPPPPEIPSSLAAAVRNGKRTLVLVGGLLLGALIFYVLWPSGSGFNYGFDGVEETEHFVTVSGTQVTIPYILVPASVARCRMSHRSFFLIQR